MEYITTLESYIEQIREQYTLDEEQLEAIYQIEDEFKPTQEGELVEDYLLDKALDAIGEIVGYNEEEEYDFIN